MPYYESKLYHLKIMKNFNFLDQVDRCVPLDDRRAIVDPEGVVYEGIVAGDYRLFDGSASFELKKESVCGIYIDDRHYIVLRSLTRSLVHRDKALFEVCGICNLPTKAELKILQDNILAVNCGLRQFDSSLAIDESDICDAFWSTETAKNPDSTWRKIIEIRTNTTVRDRAFDKWNGCRRAFCDFKIDNLLFVHKSYADPLWILQKVSPNCYYVLTERILCDSFQRKNPLFNGTIRMEGDLLIVENPLCSLDQGTVKLRKSVFAKDENGLFKKIEQQMIENLD